MTPVVRFNRQLRDLNEVVSVLRRSAVLQPVSSTEVDIEKLLADIDVAVPKQFDQDADKTAIAAIDMQLAEVLHRSLEPVRTNAPNVLHDAYFWQTVAFGPLRSYALWRWCDGESWLDDVALQIPSGASRFMTSAGSVKSQSRHVAWRLYIYADCAYGFDGTYRSLSTIFGADLDVPGAVFERRLGLAPELALTLIEVANSLVPTKGSGNQPAVSARHKRREFFKQVNLLASTVALESLDRITVRAYLDEISQSVAESQPIS